MERITTTAGPDSDRVASTTRCQSVETVDTNGCTSSCESLKSSIMNMDAKSAVFNVRADGQTVQSADEPSDLVVVS